MIGLLTLRGRLTRLNFWRASVVIALVEVAVEHLAGWPPQVDLAAIPVLPPAHFVLHGAVVLALTIVIVARLHDFGRSGWWALLLMPVFAAVKVAGPIGLAGAGLLAVGWLVLALWHGTIGPNDFGDDPRGWESREHYDAQQAALAEDAAISARGGARFHTPRTGPKPAPLSYR